MKTYDNIIKTYALALKDNDYKTIMHLFSEDAKVFSFQVGEQPPSIFFNNLFKHTGRNKVEVKNVFFDIDRRMAAAYLYLEVIWNQKYPVNFEAVDIFEFDTENKIKVLRIILDTYPIRTLKEKFLS